MTQTEPTPSTTSTVSQPPTDDSTDATDLVVKCPECPGREFENMDAYIEHVDSVHDPLEHWLNAAIIEHAEDNSS